MPTNRDRIVTSATAAISALQTVLVVFGILTVPQAAAVCALALAFLAGYRTDNANAKAAKVAEFEAEREHL